MPVVMPSPSLDQDLGFSQRIEDLPVQELVSELPVERLHIPVLPRTPRLDEERLHSHPLEPLPHRLDELGGGDPATWRYQVVVQSNEGFPEKTDLLTRKVNEFEGQHRFGGGTDFDCDPHVMDILGDPAQLADYECNPDGTVDVYFGPEAPDGKRANWVPTVPGKGFFLVFRFYGPTESYIDKSWVLNDLGLIA